MSDPTDPTGPGPDDVVPDDGFFAPAPAGGAAGHAAGRRGSRRGRKRRSGCVPVLLVLALLGGGGYLAVTRGIDAIRDQFGPAADFDGPGRGSVTFEVAPGDSLTAMGQKLTEAGIVASGEAFVDAADGASIQAGFYQLRKQMAADAVVAILTDPDQVVQDQITIPEGYTVAQIVQVLAENTDYPAKDFRRALRDPDAIGLPASAQGEPEGYLFPATYAFAPDATPTDMLAAMVDRFEQAAEDAGLARAARRLGYTEHELVTIASLVEAEGFPKDMPKIARVIYNRLENPGTAGTIGRLEIDATVAYALGFNPGTALTPEQLAVDSPYNTRLNAGLPPGPIESPGDAALKAAADPAEGDWYYYVTVDLSTGETKFATSYDEFLRFKAEYQEYCRTSSDAC